MQNEPDWIALSLALRIVMVGIKSQVKRYDSVADWFAAILAERSMCDWEYAMQKVAGYYRRDEFKATNVARAMMKIGVEPTPQNYCRLVNAARRLADPEAAEIKCSYDETSSMP